MKRVAIHPVRAEGLILLGYWLSMVPESWKSLP